MVFGKIALNLYFSSGLLLDLDSCEILLMNLTFF